MIPKLSEINKLSENIAVSQNNIIELIKLKSKIDKRREELVANLSIYKKEYILELVEIYKETLDILKNINNSRKEIIRHLNEIEGLMKEMRILSSWRSWFGYQRNIISWSKKKEVITAGKKLFGEVAPKTVNLAFSKATVKILFIKFVKVVQKMNSEYKRVATHFARQYRYVRKMPKTREKQELRELTSQFVEEYYKEVTTVKEFKRKKMDKLLLGILKIMEERGISLKDSAIGTGLTLYPGGGIAGLAAGVFFGWEYYIVWYGIGKLMKYISNLIIGTAYTVHLGNKLVYKGGVV